MTTSAYWGLEDLDVLASDLDTSLSCLGGATSTTFDMSEAISALQVIKTTREQQDARGIVSKLPSFSGSLSKVEIEEKESPSIWSVVTTQKSSSKLVKKPCRKSQDDMKTNNGFESVSTVEEDLLWSITSAPLLSQSLYKSALRPGLTMKENSVTKAEFQYVLAAPTSLGCKFGEETLTYLNQGQSYEIRLKKVHGLSEMKGKLLKSVMHVGFQERRLQFREKAEIFAWQNQRPRDRILDIDPALSYGIFDVMPDTTNINCCAFMWDPTREASVFLRINCISTEFTCKRRGGEKGVPFRILIETYSHWEDPPRKLDSAACLVKVFKSKGADRKQKTDREKIEKLPQSEQRDLQPAYQCTLFTPCSIKVEDIPLRDSPSDSANYFGNSGSESSLKSESPVISTSEVTTSTPSNAICIYQEAKELKVKCEEDAEEDDCSAIRQNCEPDVEDDVFSQLSSIEVSNWLIRHRFKKFLSQFGSFTGTDLLCLSREDLIEICGVADGIRLHNSLHVRCIRPKLTLYVSSIGPTFHAVYLESLTASEIKKQICQIYNLPEWNMKNIFVTGPSGILIHISDKFVQNMKNESAYMLEVTRADENDKYCAILQSYSFSQNASQQSVHYAATKELE